MVDKKKIFLKQKMQTKKNLFFVNHFFQSLPGIPSRRARQQVSIFCFKKVRFFCKAFFEGYSWYPFPTGQTTGLLFLKGQQPPLKYY